jgi:hypothetical protein
MSNDRQLGEFQHPPAQHCGSLHLSCLQFIRQISIHARAAKPLYTSSNSMMGSQTLLQKFLPEATGQRSHTLISRQYPSFAKTPGARLLA